MSVDLQQFCSDKDEPRYYLHQPVSRGRYTYATNGWFLVRVPRIANIPENYDAPDFEACFPRPLPTDMEPIPPVEQCSWRPVECPDCRGRESEKCSTCDGEGEHECSECGQHAPCEDCDGSGIKNRCERCGGEGWIEPDTVPFLLGDATFNQALIYQISQLPNARIATPKGVGAATAAAYFTFDGGDGLVMPMKARA